MEDWIAREVTLFRAFVRHVRASAVEVAYAFAIASFASPRTWEVVPTAGCCDRAKEVALRDTAACVFRRDSCVFASLEDFL